MRIRYSLFNSTLISCFLVYAISPLSYACAPSASAGYPAGQEGSGFRNFSIFFFEAVLKGFFPPEAAGSAPSCDAVLVIKKHAVVRLSPKIGHKLIKCTATVVSAAELCRAWSTERGYADAGVYQSAGVPVYSGLSPPYPSVPCHSIFI
jgi:hypothetical protein